MFYRIIESPPGYRPDEKYMVAKYPTLAIGSSQAIFSDTGSRFFPTIENARGALPPNAKQLPFESEPPFVELWEA